MKFIADESIPAMAVKALLEDGHDVLWLRKELPGSIDTAVFALARAERRVILTIEGEFAKLTGKAELGPESGTILVKLHTPLPRNLAMVITRIAAQGIRPGGKLEIMTEERIRTGRWQKNA